MTEVSVIIPSFRSKKTIGYCLKALENQSLSKDLYEVVVVDSSDDGTEKFIKNSFPLVKIIHLTKKTLPGEARNIGVKESVGKYIAFIDSDCICDHGLLKGMIEGLQTHDTIGIGAAVQNGTPGSIWGWVEYLINFKDFTPKVPLQLTGHVPSCSLCLSRENFKRYGPFPNDFFPGEDRVFSWKVLQAGKQFLFDPKLRVTHLNRTSFKKVIQHQVRYGKAFAITRNQYPLPGRIFVILPLFSLLGPLARWILVLIRFRWDPKLLSISLLLSPLIWVALTFWTIGFWKELREIEIKQ